MIGCIVGGGIAIAASLFVLLAVIDSKINPDNIPGQGVSAVTMNPASLPFMFAVLAVAVLAFVAASRKHEPAIAEAHASNGAGALRLFVLMLLFIAGVAILTRGGR